MVPTITSEIATNNMSPEEDSKEITCDSQHPKRQRICVLHQLIEETWAKSDNKSPKSVWNN